MPNYLYSPSFISRFVQIRPKYAGGFLIGFFRARFIRVESRLRDKTAVKMSCAVAIKSSASRRVEDFYKNVGCDIYIIFRFDFRVLHEQLPKSYGDHTVRF